MTILQRIYDYVTFPLIDQHLAKVKDARKKFKPSPNKPRRSKLDYKQDCVKLERIERELKSELITKLNRWNWLKKLI